MSGQGTARTRIGDDLAINTFELDGCRRLVDGTQRPHRYPQAPSGGCLHDRLRGRFTTHVPAPLGPKAFAEGIAADRERNRWLADKVAGKLTCPSPDRYPH